MPPRLRFLGAAGTVTGSRYLVENAGRRVLVDFGLFQGKKEIRLRNWEPLPFDATSIDAVVLTHAHVDHCAFLPALARAGFRGPIYGTRPTLDLLRLVLPDSAHLQEEQAEYANERGFSRHHPALPLYTADDAEAALALAQPMPYRQSFEIVPGFTVMCRDAGHILGSVNIEVSLGGEEATTVAFSGDVGRYGQPIIEDPEPIPAADWILCESTYGDRLHGAESGRDGLIAAIRAVIDRRGVMVIPAFAIGRTQTLLHEFRSLAAEGVIPEIPVYIDSPMAIEATRIFGRHPETYDQSSRTLLRNGHPPLDYPNLHVAAARDQSMAINRVSGPAVIISSSGMATGGRVLHHLRNRLPDERNMVLLVGYQAEGTRGRSLLDGARELKMHGRFVPVRAEVRSLGGFSAHADQSELLRWLGGFTKPPRALFLTHGEDEPRRVFAEIVRERFGWDVRIPAHGDEATLTL
ncbi:MAG: MBL fold metallo-hydrolase [Chloroflexota bacterium]|nr:MAG: MBL fold metallo-hydrolase [Chloroflexota bacterium]